MNCNHINNISFQSKIKIVSPEIYSKIVTNLKKENEYQNISQWFIIPEYSYGKDSKAIHKNIQLGSTEGIRSCTAGILTNKNEPAPVFFHLYDCQKNINQISILEPFINGTGGLLLGARNIYKHSLTLFNTVKDLIKANSIPISTFEDFKNNWEADIAFNTKKDEFYLCIKDIINPCIYIKTLAELKNAFEKIEISPNDTIEFITNSKKIFRNKI